MTDPRLPGAREERLGKYDKAVLVRFLVERVCIDDWGWEAMEHMQEVYTLNALRKREKREWDQYRAARKRYMDALEDAKSDGVVRAAAQLEAAQAERRWDRAKKAHSQAILKLTKSVKAQPMEVTHDDAQSK